MLNIGRMAPGSQRYYLHAVARGVEDYYLGKGEAPGRWLGRQVELFGLHGEVDAESLSRVLAGQDPTTGEQLASHPARKVPGFDLTFRAPKSVSLLWGLSDDTVSAQVEAAHDKAVAAALGYMERHAARTRRGAGGVEQVEVDGLVAVSFRHRTSRAMDPLLHTHVLVANLARTSDDGKWRTLDSRRLYRHARTGGFVYQAVLRDELTRRLGVAWQPVRNGVADLAGVDREWVDHFSKRRAAILAELDTRGDSSAKAAQVATLSTREAKIDQPHQDVLRSRWGDEAHKVGMPEGWWQDLLHRAVPHRLLPAVLHQLLVTEEELTEDRSTFVHRDVVRLVAERLPTGAPVEHIEDVAEWVLEMGLEQGELIGLGADHDGLAEVRPTPRHGAGGTSDGPPASIREADPSVEQRFTTRGLLLLEQHAVNAAIQRQDDRVGVADKRMLDQALRRRPTLSEEQAAMVRRLTTSGAGVDVVVGKAGTGKTFALDAARDAWQQSGLRVTGVAPAARAALELQDGAGITSMTLARLLRALDDTSHVGTPLKPGQVLVVDETGMVGTRPLARLLDHAAEQHVKVVLVGDPGQLPELDAGGLFRALTHRLPAVELHDNRRQSHEWEAQTLDLLRHGDSAAAVAAYSHHGRIVTADTVEEIRERLVSDWWDVWDHLSADTAVMVAVRRADVDDLNRRARGRLATQGLLTGPTLDVDGTEFRAGDRIVCLRNDRRLGVVNGTRGRLTAVHADHSLGLECDDGRSLTLPPWYVEAGHMAHGYAITGHKAQGMTVDHTFVLGSAELYREWGYVALSRGRHSNHLYVHRRDDEVADLDRHGLAPPADPHEALTARLGRSQAHTPVSFTTAEEWRRLTRWLATDEVRQQPALAAKHQQLADEQDRVANQFQHLIDEQLSWTAPALSRDTRQQRRKIRAATDDTETRLAQLTTRLLEMRQQLAALPRPQSIAEARRRHAELTRTIDKHVAAHIDRVVASPPDHLVRTIGTPPTDSAARDQWRATAAMIETHRARWNITDPIRALGPPTDDPVERSEAHAIIAQLRRALEPQQREVEEPPVRSLYRGLSR